MSSRHTDSVERFGHWQLLVLVLSVYVLAALAVETLFTLPTETARLLDLLDTAACMVFLVDFFWRLERAENKLVFLKWGWIDFISSIPNLDVLRWGRAVRAVRLFRTLRAVRATRTLAGWVFEHRAKGVFFTSALMTLLLIVFASVVVLNCETGERANIKTARDALWWAMATVTTVGYGDHYPVTPAGQVMGVVLMVAGAALFGTFTAFVASWFMQTHAHEKEKLDTLLREVRELREQVKKLTRKEHDTGDPSPH